MSTDRIVGYAERVYTQIRELQIDIDEFGQLHDWFDANVGWGDDIDELAPDVWAAVQARVDTLLRDGYKAPSMAVPAR